MHRPPERLRSVWVRAATPSGASESSTVRKTAQNARSSPVDPKTGQVSINVCPPWRMSRGPRPNPVRSPNATGDDGRVCTVVFASGGVPPHSGGLPRSRGHGTADSLGGFGRCRAATRRVLEATPSRGPRRSARALSPVGVHLSAGDHHVVGRPVVVSRLGRLRRDQASTCGHQGRPAHERISRAHGRTPASAGHRRRRRTGTARTSRRGGDSRRTMVGGRSTFCARRRR